MGIFFVQPSEITEEEVYSCKNVYLSGWTFNNINPLGLFEKDIFFDKEIEKRVMICYLIILDLVMKF